MYQSQAQQINVALLQTRESLLAYFRPVFHNAGLTDQQWRIIRLLAEQGMMDFREIAEQTCILRPSLTGILNRLESSGLVLRLKPQDDRRRLFLRLTELGEHRYHKILDEMNKCDQEFLQTVGKHNIEQLLRLLDTFSNPNKQEMQIEYCI